MSFIENYSDIYTDVPPPKRGDRGGGIHQCHATKCLPIDAKSTDIVCMNCSITKIYRFYRYNSLWLRLLGEKYHNFTLICWCFELLIVAIVPRNVGKNTRVSTEYIAPFTIAICCHIRSPINLYLFCGTIYCPTNKKDLIIQRIII